LKVNKPVDALDYEITQEKASALGRLGRALERSLQALTEFDAARQRETAANNEARDIRRKLTREAARALWLFAVQREACGLRDTRQIMNDYRVPLEVRNLMGVFP
jgi:hypothetical protein